MTAPAPTLDEMIEAIEMMIAEVRTEPEELAALRAAAETLRRVKECRARAEQAIADGIVVAADLEGLIA